MQTQKQRIPPGRVRDAIIESLDDCGAAMSISEIKDSVSIKLGDVAESSIRSYLLLNTPGTFIRTGRGEYALNGKTAMHSARRPESGSPATENTIGNVCSATTFPFAERKIFNWGKTRLFLMDAFEWIAEQPDASIHAVVTDPPYGIREYTPEEISKLRSGRGGIWRMPPSFGGSRRSPVPRFTVLNADGLENIRKFFRRFGKMLYPKLVPGANVIVASNPLLSSIASEALSESGLERRGELVRLTMTMRGGDRPKNAETEFGGVSVMPRSMWEPWLMFRRPLEGRVQDNLRKWGTGGFRRISCDKPFGDVVKSAPTNRVEKKLASHPSLKPQSFLRKIVRAVLPLGEGVVVDPFAGSGSTLAAAEAVGYESKGVERDETYWELACKAIPLLSKLQTADDMGDVAHGGRKLRNRIPPDESDTASLPLVF